MSSLQHWWIWRDGWVEIEPGDIFAMNDDETCYILDEGEDPMDVIGEGEDPMDVIGAILVSEISSAED